MGGIWWRVDGFDFTVLKHRKIKTFQGNNFTVSSALVIKLKVVEWCLTAKNQWELISGDDGFGFMELVFLKELGKLGLS